MGLDARRSILGVCKHQTGADFLCGSIFGKYRIKTGYKRNSNILANLEVAAETRLTGLVALCWPIECCVLFVLPFLFIIIIYPNAYNTHRPLLVHIQLSSKKQDTPVRKFSGKCGKYYLMQRAQHGSAVAFINNPLHISNRQ